MHITALVVSGLLGNEGPTAEAIFCLFVCLFLRGLSSNKIMKRATKPGEL